MPDINLSILSDKAPSTVGINAHLPLARPSAVQHQKNQSFAASGEHRTGCVRPCTHSSPPGGRRAPARGTRQQRLSASLIYLPISPFPCPRCFAPCFYVAFLPPPPSSSASSQPSTISLAVLSSLPCGIVVDCCPAPASAAAVSAAAAPPP